MRATTSALNRRSRGLAPLLSIGDAFPKVLIARTRYESYTRGACSCWISRGGCSASMGSERSVGMSRGGGGVVRARTGNAVAVWAAEGAPWTARYSPSARAAESRALKSA